MSDSFDKYYPLYQEAVSERAEIDERIVRRYEIYFGNKKTLNFTSPEKSTYSSKTAVPFRKMCFELIEAQVDTSIPLSKVTPRYAEDARIAADLEEYLNLEADIINSEDINDIAEREVRIQGTGIYQIDWDEGAGNARRKGDLSLSFIRLGDFYPQPFIDDPDDLEYVFVKATSTVRKVKETYGVDVQADNGTKTSVDLIVCWYLNDEGDVCKLIWTAQSLVVVYDVPNYFARKRRVCAQCGTEWAKGQKQCPTCGHTHSKIIDKKTFQLEDDLYVADDANPSQPPQLYIPKGTELPVYRIKALPFVIRRNIAKAGGGLYGVSDVDLIEEAQDANNKMIGKIAENIMNGGTIVTLPANATLENAAGTIKKVRIQDPRQKALVGVYQIQANVQQDDIMQDRLYQLARQSVGITDAYQGKRDPTAESGKAKEISAAQTAGRLESKYVDKTTAYAKIYKKMFEFLLAFSDEKRKIVKPYAGLNIEESSFSKYSFVTKNGAEAFINDDFIFSTNGSYMLSNKKEALWNATTQAFMAGAFGNPQDPRVVLSYWHILNRYNYPLAGKVIQFLNANQARIPLELEQALVNNPQLMEQLMAMLQAKQNIAKKKQERSALEAEEAINPGEQPLLTTNATNDIKDKDAAKKAEKEKNKS